MLGRVLRQVWKCRERYGSVSRCVGASTGVQRGARKCVGGQDESVGSVGRCVEASMRV